MKYLIAGLGNFGIDYVNTRHNVGFDIVSHLAQEKKGTFVSKRYADIAEFSFKGKSFVLIKPNTYMNLSGKAVKFYVDQMHLPFENLLVVTDDLNLPFGKMRLKKNGSDGGHNGLKSIQEVLNSTNYPRLRFGIGNTFTIGKQVDFVLGKWDLEETKTLQDKIKIASDAVLSFAMEGIERAMNQFN